MYLFVNILLLALLAAAPVGAVAGWRAAGAGKGRLRRTATALWQKETLLFCSAGGALRQKAGAVLFALGIGGYELNVCFCNSLARQSWPWVAGVLAPLLDGLVCLCFGFKILLGTKYSWRQLAVAGSVFFIARWVFLNSQNIWWIGLVLAVMAAKDAPLAPALRTYVGMGGGAMAFVALLNRVGLAVPALVSERVGAERPAYGYGHPNTFGGLLFGLVLAYALLRANKLRWGDIGLVCGAGVFLLLGPASRSAGLACLLLGVLLAVYRLRPRARLWGRRALPGLAAGLVGLVAAASYLLPLPLIKIGPWNSDFGPAWLARLDNLLTNRLSLSWVAYRVYPIKIAGQTLLDWPPLDNSFVFSLYQFGPVVTLLWAVAVAVALYGLAKNGQIPQLFCLAVMLVYSFMEVQSFHLTTNPTALLLCGVLYALPRQRWHSE
ncbi:MAG: hypothetical protein PHO10_08685 [Gemmiger sp.]|nr:hypothetical protein [Gemmiger sp.]